MLNETLPADILGYHAKLTGDARVTCERLAARISEVLPELAAGAAVNARARGPAARPLRHVTTMPLAAALLPALAVPHRETYTKAMHISSSVPSPKRVVSERPRVS